VRGEGELSDTQAEADVTTSLAGSLLAYGALLTCFAITNFTNGKLFALAHGRLGGEAQGRYLLGSLKDAGFFVCLVVLGFLLWRAVAQLWPQLRRRALWVHILIGLAIASIFLFQIVPAGMGRFYAQASVEPFLQEPDFFYRRILMPVLAHDLHLGGVLYGVFYWAVVALVLALSVLYLESKGLVLSKLELVSLCTTGVFAPALGLPGYGEILVLGFALLALLEFEQAARAGVVQLVCFGLALLTHESAAVLVFGALSLCLFGPRFLLHFVALLALYIFVWLASFGFDVHAASVVQLSGGVSNAEHFQKTIPLVLLSVLAAWKLGMIAAAVAVVRSERRIAALILVILAGSIALTYIATDYTRMIAFGTLALLVALPPALSRLSAQQRMWFAAINLAIPALYIGAHSGIHSYLGLYGLAVRPLGIPH
jgi:hypothetical protein